MQELCSRNDISYQKTNQVFYMYPSQVGNIVLRQVSVSGSTP